MNNKGDVDCPKDSWLYTKGLFLLSNEKYILRYCKCVCLCDIVLEYVELIVESKCGSMEVFLN